MAQRGNRPGRAAVLVGLLLAALAFGFPSLRTTHDAKAEPAPSASHAAPPAASAPESQAPASRWAPGQSVRLRAKNTLGVPLHPTPDSAGVSSRLHDGTTARILSIGKDARWFEIESAGGRGFVSRRYLDLGAPSARPELAADSVWASRDACLLALKRPRPPRDAKLVRVGAWNLHWFPDGGPGAAKPGHGTDLEWLACAITWLELDVLAIEEIKQGPATERALAELVTRLSALGGRSFQSLLDSCPRGTSQQRVGFLYDERRARLVKHTVLAELNPHGAPCKDQLRPGLAGYFAFPGGLDLTLVAVHLKSGVDARAFALRERSFAAFANAAATVRKLTSDGDVLVLGDMNTMGCEACAPAVTAPLELETRRQGLASAGFRGVPSEPPVSHYYAGKATLLDWAAASDLAEFPALRRAQVSGPCGELAGALPRGELAAARRLSDHCPFVLDLDDRDSD